MDSRSMKNSVGCGVRRARTAMKAVLIAAMALVAMSAGAQAQQKYPPYPDVWGRELPVSGRGNHSVDIDIYPAADGDMLAYESIFVHERQKSRRTIHRMSFFSGRDDLVTEAELKQQERKWPGPTPRSRGLRLKFSDGYSLDNLGLPEKLLGDWHSCLSIPFYHGMKNFRFEIRKTLVRVFPSVMDIKTTHGTYCDPNKQPTTFKTKVRFAFLTSNQDYILPDGTFLTVLDDDFIVRFDRTLHSPFIDQRPDLFLVDFAQVEPIFAEATRREKDDPGFNPLQFIHDRLTDLVAAMPKPPTH